MPLSMTPCKILKGDILDCKRACYVIAKEVFTRGFDIKELGKLKNLMGIEVAHSNKESLFPNNTMCLIY